MPRLAGRGWLAASEGVRFRTRRSKAFTLCCTLDEAKAVREEVAFFQCVKVILTKREISAQKKTNEERELAIAGTRLTSRKPQCSRC